MRIEFVSPGSSQAGLFHKTCFQRGAGLVLPEASIAAEGLKDAEGHQAVALDAPKQESCLLCVMLCGPWVMHGVSSHLLGAVMCV